MNVVPTTQVYVDANFKEVQLRKVKPGQPVELKSDLYGSKAKFHGTVVGFAGGTAPSQHESLRGISITARPRVLRASDDELMAHVARLDQLDKAVGGTSLWRQMDAEAAQA